MSFKKPISRIQPTLPIRDLIAFLVNMMRPKSQPVAEAIVADFEDQFSRRYDLSQGVCFSKARVAFYFLLKNMGLKPGGEVLISAIHVADFVNMIRLAGYRPVVVDLQASSYVIDYKDLERKINKNSAAMLITHLSGYSTDMGRIVEISKRHNLPFIEDCSQVVSSKYNGRRLGVFGRAAIFSLSLLKPVCTLSGGMVLSNDAELLNKLRQERRKLRQHKKFPLIMEAIKNIIIKVAVNPVLFRWITFPLMRFTMPLGDYFSRYQKTNKTVMLRHSMPKDFLVSFSWQQAVMGLSQLRTLEKREKERVENGLYLYDRLVSHACIKLPIIVKESLNTFWLFPVIADDTDKLKRFLAKYGIDSSKFLLSLICAEEAFKEYGWSSESAKFIKNHTLFIPMYKGLTKGQLDHVVDCIGMYNDQTV